MAIDLSPVLTGVAEAVGLAIGGGLLTTAASVWAAVKVNKPQTPIVIASLGFGISVSALLLTLMLKPSNDIIAGNWNGQKLSEASKGAKIKVNRQDSKVIRIDYSDYGFSSTPVIVIGNSAGRYAFIKHSEKDFADISVYTLDKNGFKEEDTGGPFQFQVVPAVFSK